MGRKAKGVIGSLRGVEMGILRIRDECLGDSIGAFLLCCRKRGIVFALFYRLALMIGKSQKLFAL